MKRAATVVALFCSILVFQNLAEVSAIRPGSAFVGSAVHRGAHTARRLLGCLMGMTYCTMDVSAPVVKPPEPPKNATAPTVADGTGDADVAAAPLPDGDGQKQAIPRGDGTAETEARTGSDDSTGGKTAKPSPTPTTQATPAATPKDDDGASSGKGQTGSGSSKQGPSAAPAAKEGAKSGNDKEAPAPKAGKNVTEAVNPKQQPPKDAQVGGGGGLVQINF